MASLTLIKIFRNICLILLITLGLGATGVSAKDEKTTGKVIFDNNNYAEQLKSQKPLVPHKLNKQAIIDIEGELAVLLPEKKELVFKRGSIKTVVNKVNENKEFPSTKGVWLHKSPNKLYALWWTKGIESKKLRVKSSSDNGKTFSEKAVIIANKGVLPNVITADDGDQGIAVAYISERNAGYQLYFNRSIDGGKTWFKEDVRINDLYTREGKVKELIDTKKVRVGSHVSDPFITFAGGKLILVYQESIVKDNKTFLRIVSKVSDNFGESWVDNEVFTYPNVPPQDMHIERSGDELFASIFIPKKGIYTFSMQLGRGQSWKSLGVLPGTEKLISASAMHAMIINNKVNVKRIITFTAKSLYQQNRVMFFESTGNAEWRDVTAEITRRPIVSSDTAEGYAYTKLQFSNLAEFGGSLVIAIWEDHTYLVPTIVYNYSVDGGVSWKKEPLFINYPTTNVQKYPKFLKNNKRLWLLSSQYDLSLKAIGNSPIVANKVAELNDKGNIVFYLPSKPLEKNIPEKKKLAILKKRAKEYWNYKIKGEFAKTYDYLEPIYRSVYTRDMMIKAKSLLTYKGFKLGDVKRIGNIAIMDTTLTFVLGGNNDKKMVSTDDGKAKTSTMKARWGWFYDNWYIMPDALFDRRRDL